MRNGGAHTGDECLSLQKQTGELCGLKSYHDGPHSWEGPLPLELRARLDGVHADFTARGVEIKLKIALGQLDNAVAGRLHQQVGKIFTLTVLPEAEQKPLPLDG